MNELTIEESQQAFSGQFHKTDKPLISARLLSYFSHCDNMLQKHAIKFHSKSETSTCFTS